MPGRAARQASTRRRAWPAGRIRPASRAAHHAPGGPTTGRSRSHDDRSIRRRWRVRPGCRPARSPQARPPGRPSGRRRAMWPRSRVPERAHPGRSGPARSTIAPAPGTGSGPIPPGHEQRRAAGRGAEAVAERSPGHHEVARPQPGEGRGPSTDDQVDQVDSEPALRPSRGPRRRGRRAGPGAGRSPTPGGSSGTGRGGSTGPSPGRRSAAGTYRGRSAHSRGSRRPAARRVMGRWRPTARSFRLQVGPSGSLRRVRPIVQSSSRRADFRAFGIGRAAELRGAGRLPTGRLVLGLGRSSWPASGAEAGSDLGGEAGPWCPMPITRRSAGSWPGGGPDRRAPGEGEAPGRRPPGNGGGPLDGRRSSRRPRSPPCSIRGPS